MYQKWTFFYLLKIFEIKSQYLSLCHKAVLQRNNHSVEALLDVIMFLH